MQRKMYNLYPVMLGVDCIRVPDVYHSQRVKLAQKIQLLNIVTLSFFLSLFSTVPLHSLKYNSQRLNRRNSGVITVKIQEHDIKSSTSGSIFAITFIFALSLKPRFAAGSSTARARARAPDLVVRLLELVEHRSKRWQQRLARGNVAKLLAQLHGDAEDLPDKSDRET